MLIALASNFVSRSASARGASLTAEEELSIVGACARTIRWQLAIFYFASGFWKVNSSFLHPSYSCASLFTVQPLEYLPDDLLFAWRTQAGLSQPSGAQPLRGWESPAAG